ncbi:unnamed protein product [Soboliphyme baturini]|uniref:PHTB1_C domain-containing protein n=1 Tax=Soboliphyme baturini TaxID=241478 RepID=A0A183IMQ7_9BILA|nr:unnamed protein product [Soboliphyme baturini]
MSRFFRSEKKWNMLVSKIAGFNIGFQLEDEGKELSAKLNKVASQYRVVERQFLIRMKSFSPNTLDRIERLLSMTHGMMLSLSDDQAEFDRKLRKVYNDAVCCLLLLFELLKINFDLSNDALTVLRSCIPYSYDEQVFSKWLLIC